MPNHTKSPKDVVIGQKKEIAANVSAKKP